MTTGTPPDAVRCDDCQAEPGEPCRVDCLGLATLTDADDAATPPDAVCAVHVSAEHCDEVMRTWYAGRTCNWRAAPR